MNPIDWIISRDTGTSSKTIWAVMMGAELYDSFMVDIPHDPSDFGRCHRLLNHFPEWRDRLPEVAERFPKWLPLVNHWDELTELYNEERKQETAPKLYEKLQALRNA